MSQVKGPRPRQSCGKTFQLSKIRDKEKKDKKAGRALAARDKYRSRVEPRVEPRVKPRQLH